MKQIRTDFQGWPVNAKTVREILEDLCIWNKGNIFRFSNEILDAYPKLFDDDGMAYGVNPRYISEVDKNEIYTDEELREKVFNIFGDPLVRNDKE